MNRVCAALFGLLVLSITTAPLSAAHGEIFKITIEGAGLAAPIEITEPGIEYFSVWTGPGTFPNGLEQTEGFIIDWPQGITGPPPDGLQRYQVSFYAGCQAGQWECRNPGSVLVYVVLYDFDPAAGRGFVYLPGRGDELFQFNYRLARGHGFEGNWLHARKEWDEYVAPRIAKARNTDANR